MPDHDAASAASGRRFDFAVLEDYDKGDDIAQVRRDFASFRELGITTWRGSLGWDDFEPEEGRFDFNWLEQFVSAAETDGITLRPYIGYTPAWASDGGKDGDVWNDPPASLDTWGAFVRALVSTLGHHRNVASLEIYNEENVPQWWDGTASQYRQVLERAAREIRAANPRLQVILGGMVFPDTAWLDQICGEPAASVFDILPFHAYPETWTPADVDLERYLGPQFESGFVRAADDACGRRPIWINETGFATIDGVSEEAQAGWWARALATFASEPRIEHIGVYEIKDLAPDREAIGGTPNYHLGLERADGTRKLAFATVSMLAGMFNGGGFEVVPVRVERREGTSDRSEIFSHAFRLANAVSC